MTEFINKADFERLTELAMNDPGRAHMRPVIQKELLHYDILYCLDSAGLLDQLTFQGGTSLRLCHGSPRFSEDLDFVGGKGFTRQQLEPIKDCIEYYINQRYGLKVTVKEPNELKDEREYANLKIEKWQIAVITAPQRKHIPQQRIKVEVANIDAYSREPRALQLNYTFLPDGYGDTLKSPAFCNRCRGHSRTEAPLADATACSAAPPQSCARGPHRYPGAGR